MADYRGARGSNAGDDFHELWVARQAIGLLSNEDGLEAIAVEGVSATDEQGVPRDAWDGVDCTLYFDGESAAEASRIQVVQLKYSSADPNKQWTVARLAGRGDGRRRDRSVIHRLAEAWQPLFESSSQDCRVEVAFVSNQPIESGVATALQRAATSGVNVPTRKPSSTAPTETKMAYASGLNAEDFAAFADALEFLGGTDSRSVLGTELLKAVGEWFEHDIQQPVNGLRQFIRQCMMPDSAGKLITRESVRLQLTGASTDDALFPCPPNLAVMEDPICRSSARDASTALVNGCQHVCLHGQAGTGKTTALQEIAAALPDRSVMVTYDCYGGGSYLNSNALRHRNQDAFVQMINELASQLKLPLFLNPQQGFDYPRLFQKRLELAAAALAREAPGALIVIAIDAADNAVNAAKGREERAFTFDFLSLEQSPENVRFIVTSRSGRMVNLDVPGFYRQFEITPFELAETKANVARLWAAPDAWIEDFHHFSNGIPRVQSYALEGSAKSPEAAMKRLMPNGKSLEGVFDELFEDALKKAGDRQGTAMLCAGLIALPRPVPLSHLGAVLDKTPEWLTDVCTDLAPGVRMSEGTVSFVDEDFEDFVRQKGRGDLQSIRSRVADRLFAHAENEDYAAFNVAGVLFAADRRNELLRLVESEPAPLAVEDPVLRREAELQRLRFAIKVCREAGDVSRALRFVLIGAEGVKTEKALRQLLIDNPDCAARFAQETAGRLILSDATQIEHHGRLLFQKLTVDADRKDRISHREGRRSIDAWLRARQSAHAEKGNVDWHWKIEFSDVSSTVEAALKLGGTARALDATRRWRPKTIAYETASTLPHRLIAQDYWDDVQTLANEEEIGIFGRVLLWMALALAGRKIDLDLVASYLDDLDKTRLHQWLKESLLNRHQMSSVRALMLETVVLACEVLTGRQAAQDVVDEVLQVITDPELRRIDNVPVGAFQFDLLARAYALAETRSGREPKAEELFTPRPEPPETGNKHITERERNHDEELQSMASVSFDIYSIVAKGLVGVEPDIERKLRNACQRMDTDDWRLSRRFLTRPLRVSASIHVTTLLQGDCDPARIKRIAASAHGGWRVGNWVPNERLIARLSLHPQLHSSLIEDLGRGAEETAKMRLGADEKSRSLVDYARLMLPLSEPDAQATFNHAVEVASELDLEVMDQIKFLEALVASCHRNHSSPRSVARELSNVVADAAIRMDGYDHFPWSEAMHALTLLDLPLALANVGRWDQEGKASLWSLLPPVLQSALGAGSIPPQVAAALTLLEPSNGNVVATALTQAARASDPGVESLAEEVARIVLLYQNDGRLEDVGDCIRKHHLDGFWVSSLVRQEDYLKSLPKVPASGQQVTTQKMSKTPDFLANHQWQSATLIDSLKLQEAIEGLQTLARQRKMYSDRKIFGSARSSVRLPERIDHLEALAGIRQQFLARDAIEALLDALDDWQETPAVKDWCQSRLPEAIVSHFDALARYLPYEKDNFHRALNGVVCSDAERQNLILRGIEQSVDSLGAEAIFALAGHVVDMMRPEEAASLLDWYVARLDDRIPLEHKDQTAPPAEVPQQADEAVARFLFAYMGDCDLRLRWRAAHAVRCLARVGEVGSLEALVAQYARREESVFRADQGFYWLAARLWLVIAWDRVADEAPNVVGRFGEALLEIALDSGFPHILVRAFARDACEKLIVAGELELDQTQRASLMAVNETDRPKVVGAHSMRSLGSGWHSGEGKRFRFDPMDTLPYWYAPVLRSFAGVDMDRFLNEAERWILDEWGYTSDRSVLREGQPQGRFERQDWSLAGHGHGSIPTLEELHTHLEWHAMWCAAGELLKTEPLPAPSAQNMFDRLEELIREEKLSEPPLWRADLRLPVPHQNLNWLSSNSKADQWVEEVNEANHRDELFPADVPQYLVVGGSGERASGECREEYHVSSALVEPATGRSLLRSLQTMGYWDYGMPSESDSDRGIDHPPYRFLGWLRYPNPAGRIEDKDPFRSYLPNIRCRPGRRVIAACKLSQDDSWKPSWSNASARRPMFRYESWGAPPVDDDRRFRRPVVCGDRLLVDREQLLEFLHTEKLDLIVEVEVTRRGRESERYYREKGVPKPERHFVRLYRLDSRGGLEIAEGRIGTWTGNSQPT